MYIQMYAHGSVKKIIKISLFFLFFHDCPVLFTGSFQKLHFLSAPSSFVKFRMRMRGMKISSVGEGA